MSTEYSTITIHFDGGCQPNPGNKYGSFEVLLDGIRVHKAERVKLGWGTNNEAEFDIFIEALKWVQNELPKGGFEPHKFDLEAFTDSTIVRNRLVKPHLRGNSRMWKLANRCLAIALKFRSFRANWNRRDRNVARFGH